MRKILLVILAVFLSAPVFSQEIIIGKADGSSQSLDLSNLKKVTFLEGYLVADYADGSSATKYLLSEISRLLFSNSTQVEPVEMMDGRIAYQAETGSACIIGSEGLVLSVYNISGRMVMQESITSSVQTVALDDLKSGIYLLRLGDRTIKIVR